MNISKSLKKSSGVTLQEVLLVLVLCGAILIIGMRFVNSLRSESDTYIVKGNVDSLFQAAANFYYANCRRQQDPVNGPVAGTGLLDPTDDGTGTPVPATPYPVAINTLQTNGYFDGRIITTPIADNYIVQFNQVTPAPDRIIQTASGPVNVGKIIMWRIQISVLLDPVYTPTAVGYLSRLGGSCLSRLDASGTSVIPCNQMAGVPAGGNIYVVWERLPSLAVPSAPSGLMRTNARNKLNTQLYTDLPQDYLLKQPSSTYPLQNFLCGS